MTHQPPLMLPPRRTEAHKGNFGRCLLVGGSRGMSGSISLSAMAALHSGSGLVTAAVPDRCLETVASSHPCVMTVPMPDDGSGRFSLQASETLIGEIKGASVIGCGPGMTTAPGSLRMVERLLHQRTIPRVFDADAINLLAAIDWIDSGSSWGPMVLTPHPGEFQRLTGVEPSDREGQMEAAKTLVAKTDAVVVLKGGPTVVLSRDQVWTNDNGNPGMATAGSGDVLTGVVASLLGQGHSPGDAAKLGVWVHGHAGDLAASEHGQAGMTALEILAAIPQAISDAMH